MPVTAHGPRSAAENRIQLRAGLVGMTCIVTGLLVLALAGWWVAGHVDQAVASGPPVAFLLISAALLAAMSVLLPRPVFRTRGATVTRTVLGNPLAPDRPWRATTITFNMVLVGALVAGLYYGAALSIVFFGAAFIVRIVVLGHVMLARDPNARYHALVPGWASAAGAATAFVIVAPLSANVSIEGSIVPLVLAAMVSMYVGLAMSAVDRWVLDDRGSWLFLRDALDTRRIVVALGSAFIAWTIAIVHIAIERAFPDNPEVTGALAGLAVFLLSVLVLWLVSIRMWLHESMRTLRIWSRHQSEVMARISDGSLSPELAARASLPITARMAIAIFGATRAMVVVDDGRGSIVTHVAVVDAYPHGHRADPRAMVEHSALRIPLYPIPDHPNTSSVTISQWLWAGWFVTGSPRVVGAFTDLATSALLLPVIAANNDRDAVAFDNMFDRINRWPTLAAFGEAVGRMQTRTDANPHIGSLLIGVYSIDGFGAIAGGRFEHAAVAQVMRLTLGYQQFAGHDLFAAYEEPGRLWLALGGGPIIRNGIGLLRGLQEHINDHGSVPSSKMDLDVHVGVSFGYAVHQVDEFTQDGLMAAALHRLAIDQGSRDPFSVENLLAYDIRPEDITGGSDAPVTAVDMLALLRRDADTDEAFTTRFSPVVDNETGRVDALLLGVGWQRSFGSRDLADPETFLALVGRQSQLAAEATRIALSIMKQAFGETSRLNPDDLPIVIALPSILLHPDAAEVALPNLVTPFLDRRECARSVILFDSIPEGGGQALRLLSDRGIQLAVTAAATAGADPADLFGWLRWGILFPRHIIQGTAGIDGMTIQQTALAIGTRDTRLIGVADAQVDLRELARNGIRWTTNPGQNSPTAVGSAIG